MPQEESSSEGVTCGVTLILPQQLLPTLCRYCSSLCLSTQTCHLFTLSLCAVGPRQPFGGSSLAKRAPSLPKGHLVSLLSHTV